MAEQEDTKMLLLVATFEQLRWAMDMSSSCYWEQSVEFTLNLLYSQQSRGRLLVTHMFKKESSSANQGRYS